MSVRCWIIPYQFTHWSRAVHMRWAIINADYGWAPVRRQAITLTNDGLMSTEPGGTNFTDIVIQKKNITKIILDISFAQSSGPFVPAFCVTSNHFDPGPVDRHNEHWHIVISDHVGGCSTGGMFLHLSVRVKMTARLLLFYKNRNLHIFSW